MLKVECIRVVRWSLRVELNDPCVKSLTFFYVQTGHYSTFNGDKLFKEIFGIVSS